jgi:excisionase family DNA binding protein
MQPSAEERRTSRQRREDAVAEPCPDRATASSGAVVIVMVGDDPQAAAGDALGAARAALERAAAAGPDAVLAAPATAESGEDLLTTREAAAALGISVSTARRWSDEGRLPTTKTSGGHRRFRVADLRGLARHAPRPRLRLAPAPEVALPVTAAVVGDHRPLVGSVWRSLYENGSAGWFAREAVDEELGRWFATLAAACRSGGYDGAIAATSRLAQRARAAGATALECSLFLDRLGAATARAVSLAPKGAAEVKETLRLFVVLRQAALA